MSCVDISRLSSVELIRELSLLFGPTGCEDRVADTLFCEAEKYSQKIVRDRMGNIIAKVSLGDEKKRKKIMLSAHMDEVGFMIEEIKGDGMLTFACIGGIDPSVIAGRKVFVGNENSLISGVVCSKAIHHKTRSERSVAVDSERLYIDIGAFDDDEAKQYVSVGDFATFDSEFFRFGADGKTIKCKALDDRMGCAVLIELMRRLDSQKIDADLDIYFCFTTREEIGLSGAEAVAERIRPDFALVFESTAVGDIADTPSNKRVADLSQGAVISVADRGTIYDKQLIDLAFDVAKKKNIPLQVKRYLSGGNDASHIHKSGIGVRTLAISVPTRYLHSATCVAHLDDYDSSCKIAYELLGEIGRL